MNEQPEQLLRSFARRFSGKTSACNVHDANASTGSSSVEGSRRQISGSGAFFLRLRLVHQGRDVLLMVNRDYLQLSCNGSFDLEPFTINVEERVGFPSRPTDTRIVGYPVFTGDGKISSRQQRILTNSRLVELLREIQFREGESLHLFRNVIVLYLIRPAEERAVAAMGGLVGLVNDIESAETEELEFSKLPKQFQSLVPLIKKWAIGDDQERADFQESLPRQALEAFVDEVEPYLRSIDKYLSSFGDQPPSEEAAALGRLAECAVEIKRHLESEAQGC
jgi:hypothetical protein